jgi:hypothetical protein
LRAFSRRNVFLTPALVEDWYQLPADATTRRSLLRTVHPAKMLARYALAVSRVRMRGSWTALPASVAQAAPRQAGIG